MMSLPGTGFDGSCGNDDGGDNSEVVAFLETSSGMVLIDPYVVAMVMLMTMMMIVTMWMEILLLMREGRTWLLLLHWL
jgi:hypothetical protein